MSVPFDVVPVAVAAVITVVAAVAVVAAIAALVAITSRCCFLLAVCLLPSWPDVALLLCLFLGLRFETSLSTAKPLCEFLYD